MRTILTALGIAVGVAAVVLLTSIGEGVRRFVVSEFTQFGTNIIGITPGATQTMGGSIGVFGTVRPLTIDDAEALRRVPFVLDADPVVQGNAEVEGNGRKRRVTVYGTGPLFAESLRFPVGAGRLPATRRSAESTQLRGAGLEDGTRAVRRQESARGQRDGSVASATGSIGVMAAEGHGRRHRPRRHRVHPGRAGPGTLQPRQPVRDRRHVRGGGAAPRGDGGHTPRAVHARMATTTSRSRRSNR